MSKVTTVEVQRILAELSRLKREKEKRDQWTYSQVLLDSATALQEHFDRWLRDEIDTMLKEADLVKEIIDPQALKELSDLRDELKTVRESKVKDAKQKLAQFVARLKREEYEKTSQVITDLIDLVDPSISLIQELSRIRGKVDSVIVREVLPLASDEFLTPEEDKDLEEAINEAKLGKAPRFNNSDELIKHLKS